MHPGKNPGSLVIKDEYLVMPGLCDGYESCRHLMGSVELALSATALSGIYKPRRFFLKKNTRIGPYCGHWKHTALIQPVH